jgi:hypothetical protein
MYACILEIRRGFFEGVSTLTNAAVHLRDPPLPLDSRIDSEGHVLAVPICPSSPKMPNTTSEKAPSRHVGE